MHWISNGLYNYRMRLDRWIAKQPYGALKKLARDTGLAYGTVFGAYRRTTQTSYASALKIQKATKGAVTVADLCTPRAKRKRAA